MIPYDFHIHHELCGHAEGMTTRAIAERIDALGLEAAAVTDHLFSPRSIPRLEQIRREFAELDMCTRVLIGAEVDVDGRHTDGRLVTDDFGQFDYILAGFHYIPGVGNYPHGPEDCPLEPEEMFAVWRSSLLGVVSNPQIDALAHPGRLASVALDLDIFWDDMLGVFEEAAALSAKNDIMWELNELSGRKVPVKYHDNWHRIYEIALAAGVELIYGSDAHSPGEIGACAFVEKLLSKLPAGVLCDARRLDRGAA